MPRCWLLGLICPGLAACWMLILTPAWMMKTVTSITAKNSFRGSPASSRLVRPFSKGRYHHPDSPISRATTTTTCDPDGAWQGGSFPSTIMTHSIRGGGGGGPRNFSSSTRPRSMGRAAALASARDDSLAATRAEDHPDGPPKSSSSSTVAAATFGLIKAMVGTGVLALPGGLAVASNYPSALWPANAVLAVLGLWSAYTFALYGRLTHETQATSLGDLWKRVYSRRPTTTTTTTGIEDPTKSTTDSSYLVSAASLIYCFGCCLTFSLVIADALSSLLGAAGATGWWAGREAVLLAVTTTVLWPLGNLPSLAALAPVSVVGVLGTLVTTLFVMLRCPRLVPTSPYALLPRGRFLSTATALPTFSTYHRASSPAPLVLVAMGCVALMAHFSAPDFYHSLAPASESAEPPKKSTLAKFNAMTIMGYLSVMIINALTLTFGFLTFGGASSGIILNNYAVSDWGASLSRLLVTISVMGGYPFLLVACRAACLELWAKGHTITRAMEQRTTLLLLSVITGIALVVKNVGFVVSFNGALMGTTIIYTLPALLFLRQNAGGLPNPLLRLERGLCRFLLGFGVSSSLVGGATSVLVSYFPQLIR